MQPVDTRFAHGHFRAVNKGRKAWITKMREDLLTEAATTPITGTPVWQQPKALKPPGYEGPPPAPKVCGKCGGCGMIEPNQDDSVPYSAQAALEGAKKCETCEGTGYVKA